MQIDSRPGWVVAADEALVVVHLGVANENDSTETAKKKLANLIAHHIAIATDPAVNGGFELVKVDESPKKLAAKPWLAEEQPQLAEVRVNANLLRAAVLALVESGVALSEKEHAAVEYLSNQLKSLLQETKD